LSDPNVQHSKTTETPNMEWDIDNLPNRLTIFRLILVPVVVAALMFNLDFFEVSSELKSTLGWTAAWIFVVASITDFFDGYIARKRQIVTVFGSFLDPIADKFLVVSSILMLQALDRIPVILVIILVLREFYITSLRLLAGDRGFKIPVGEMGKWKTATQMVGIPMLMANEKGLGIPFPIIGIVAIYLSAFISIYSASDYSISLLKKIRENRKDKKE
jgi:CDP-diacylglycerol--glycerol-3-phosphate 3-phosphatidyltransferase